MSFCCFVVLSHANVRTKGFFDILKNGTGFKWAIFELAQHAQASKIDIFAEIWYASQV